MIALFCGSRAWTDRDAIDRDMEALPDDTIVIEGGATGADRMARYSAIWNGFHVATVEAQWNLHGRAAGPKRNRAMLLLKPDVVYAYQLDTSRGTRDMTRVAQEAGIPVHIRTQALT